MRWWLAAYIAAQVLDMGTTAYKIHQGCREAVWPSAGAMYAAKGTSIALTFALAASHPHVAVVIGGVGIVSGTYGTIQNMRTACS